MNILQKLTAQKLLSVKAVKLQPSNPFTWASGWKSPIYCDNRKLMSYPTVRNFLKIEFARIILENHPDVEAIAGVATGAIAPGAIVADALGLPFVYVRSTPKGHGMENLIEGDLKPKQKVVVIEDLISTGGSSLKAVEAIRNNGAEVLGMVAIFTYGFPIAEQKMNEADVKLITLCNYDAILDEALATNYIDKSELSALQEWRKNPSEWEGVKK
jgi:orotate phosphoribosyltransferase